MKNKINTKAPWYRSPDFNDQLPEPDDQLPEPTRTTTFKDSKGRVFIIPEILTNPKETALTLEAIQETVKKIKKWKSTPQQPFTATTPVPSEPWKASWYCSACQKQVENPHWRLSSIIAECPDCYNALQLNMFIKALQLNMSIK